MAQWNDTVFAGQYKNHGIATACICSPFKTKEDSPTSSLDRSISDLKVLGLVYFEKFI